MFPSLLRYGLPAMFSSSQHSDQSNVSGTSTPPSCEIQRRLDGAVLVRVRSREINGRTLPDAVFAFRAGDPQFGFWDEQLRRREPLPSTSPTLTIPLPTYETH